MIEIQNDEHICGFLYREQLAKGKIVDFNFSNTLVLQTSESWRLLPTNLHEINVLGKSGSDILNNHTLYNLFKATAAPSQNGNSYYRHNLDYVSMRFVVCIECLKEQMYECGFHWFKREWLIYQARVCSKHIIYLTSLYCGICTSHLSINISIKSILRGYCAKCKNWISFGEPKIAPGIPKLNLWFYDLLNDPLPHLSTSLMKSILIESAIRTGAQSNLDINNLCSHLWNLCNVEGHSSNKIKDSKNNYGMAHRGHKITHLKMILESEKIFSEVPFLLFWQIASAAFESYKEFQSFFQTHYQKKTREGFDFEYLDVI